MIVTLSLGKRLFRGQAIATHPFTQMLIGVRSFPEAKNTSPKLESGQAVEVRFRLMKTVWCSQRLVSALATVPLAYSRPACIQVIRQSWQGIWMCPCWKSAIPLLMPMGPTVKGPYRIVTRCELCFGKNWADSTVTLEGMVEAWQYVKIITAARAISRNVFMVKLWIPELEFFSAEMPLCS